MGHAEKVTEREGQDESDELNTEPEGGDDEEEEDDTEKEDAREEDTEEDDAAEEFEEEVEHKREEDAEEENAGEENAAQDAADENPVEENEEEGSVGVHGRPREDREVVEQRTTASHRSGAWRSWAPGYANGREEETRGTISEGGERTIGAEDGAA